MSLIRALRRQIASFGQHLQRFHRPAYTGQNRCWPCTALNAVIVIALAAALSLYSYPLAALALVAGALLIALRGYVVPGTPRFAPKLVAASPLPASWFRKAQRADRDSLVARGADGETVLRALSAAGALEADGDVVRPTESVDERWHREQDLLAARSLDALAAIATDELPGTAGVRAHDDGGSDWLVVDGDLVARPVAVTELAAHRALGGVVDDPDLRLAGARAFRMFLDSCPVCESSLALSSEVACCGGYTDPTGTPAETLVCPSCEQRLYTFPSE
jgi:hypothetical protein